MKSSIVCSAFLSLGAAQLLPYIDDTIFTSTSNVSFFPSLEDVETPDLFPMSSCGSFTLEEATIDDMQDAMANGTLTSVQLCLCYLQRALQTNQYIK